LFGLKKEDLKKEFSGKRKKALTCSAIREHVQSRASGGYPSRPGQIQ
jgi:hypothetical protein